MTIEELNAMQKPGQWRSEHYEDWTRGELLERVLWLQAAGRHAWERQAEEYVRGLQDGELGERAANEV